MNLVPTLRRGNPAFPRRSVGTRPLITIAGLGNRTMAPAIIIQNLSMSFSGRHGVDPVHVLDGINLKVAQGEFVCLVGPSGCGKSTILNILGGFLEPTHGEVLVGGEPVRGPDP